MPLPETPRMYADAIRAQLQDLQNAHNKGDNHMNLKELLTKQRDELESKGGNRSAYETQQLANLKVKLAAMKKAD